VEQDNQSQYMKQWSNKSDLEQSLLVGLNGAPELKIDEKRQYLGEYRERVLKLLTKHQVEEPGFYPEIKQSLQDSRADKLIISGDVSDSAENKYRKLAEQVGKRHSVIHDPEFKGNAGLIVVSNNAVDEENISIQDRKEKFKQLGLSAKLADCAGKKLCENCLHKILSAAPEEEINYQKLTFWDRFWGEACPACVNN
jgi:uncharacterized protein YueI